MNLLTRPYAYSGRPYCNIWPMRRPILLGAGGKYLYPRLAVANSQPIWGAKGVFFGGGEFLDS